MIPSLLSAKKADIYITNRASTSAKVPNLVTSLWKKKM